MALKLGGSLPSPDLTEARRTRYVDAISVSPNGLPELAMCCRPKEIDEE